MGSNLCAIINPTAVESINGVDDPNGWYFSAAEIDSFWVTSNNTDISPIITPVPDVNGSDGSQVERHSWINGDGCVAVEELKIIKGGHDRPSPLSSWANQDINTSAEVYKIINLKDLACHEY